MVHPLPDDLALAKRCRQFMKDTQKRCVAVKNRAGMVTRPQIRVEFDFPQLLVWFAGKQEAPGIWRCAYCQIRLVLPDVQVDHDVPLAIGGRAALDNQQIACALCNREKGELRGVDFVALLALLRTMNFAAETYVRTALRMVGIAKRQRFFPRTPKPATAPAAFPSTTARRR